MSEEKQDPLHTILSALAGGVIGLVFSSVVLLRMFGRTYWFPGWLFAVCVAIATVGGGVASAIYGAAFWDRVISEFTRK